ncbi:MAG: transglutaminase domain-containing protein, partial [Alphaproteobacteria bacterium]|nr:transglutaminase domain-containing protein [Alphaproteobacteria bacterium]
ARFVTGYAENLPNPDFHACMEAYVNGRWKLFDPSRKIDPAELVRIGTGHDAAEASFCTIYSDEIVEMTFMQVFAESAE